MYENVKTWTPHPGCTFNCIYCIPSFQRQAKRRKKYCELCYEYKPHFHPERLNRVPSAKTIFCNAFGDISHAPIDIVKQIMEVIEKHKKKTFYIQTKNPIVYCSWEREFDIPDNVVLGTTIESNREKWEYLPSVHHVPYCVIDYTDISRAPSTFHRYISMSRKRRRIPKPLFKHDRRFLTYEPILDFDLETMVKWAKEIVPEFVYIGYDNHGVKVKPWDSRDSYRLPEPPLSKTLKLIEELEKFTEVRLKTIRKVWWEVGKNGFSE